MRVLRSIDREPAGPAHRAALSLYRIVLGLLFACHGASSLFGILGGNLGKGGTISAASFPDGTAALIELVTGVLVLAGLVPRAAALLASGTMAYAYFTVHQPKSLWPIENGGEQAALFCWGFLMVALFGAGDWTLPALLRQAGLPIGARAEESA
ncbi:MAG TPA: DoxX family protein [Actinocrinis sp.]|nr:DoxX family protein [Actinocrinis sp.]